MKILNSCPFNLSDNKTRILWEITPRCNMSCKHCLFFQNNQNGFMQEMKLDDVYKIIDNISKDKNVTAIWLSGGEPLLRKDIVQICEYISNKNIVPSLSTNGVLLNEELIESLYNAGVRYIHLSLDGAKASTHDKLRGVKGAYSKLMDVMELLKKSPIRSGASFMVTEESIDEIEDVIKIADEKGLNVLSFYLVAELGRGAENYKTDKSNLAERLANKIEKIEKLRMDNSKLKIELFRADKPSNCEENVLQKCKGSNFLNITYDGKLGACPWFMKSEEGFDVGSILENDFIELEEKCKNIMKEKIEERQNNIEYCKKCPNEALCGKGCIALQNLNKGSYYKLDPICPNIKRTVGANNKDTDLLKEA